MKFRDMMLGAVAALAIFGSTMAPTKAQDVDAIRWGIPMAFGSNRVALGDTMPWV